MDVKRVKGMMTLSKGIKLIALVVMLTLILAACGSVDEEEVVGDITTHLDTLESYKANVNLTLQTGEQPQEYDVEVWYKNPDFYRVSLTNHEREITQIILKNEDGVFVLTPHLNKSFRFQSQWPDNQGQVYLYESLMNDIINDAERVFNADGDEYVFETKANYQNKMLTTQKIWLTKDLKPVQVNVMDADYNVLVEVEFSNVEFDYTFEDGAFDMQKNMESATSGDMPAMASSEEQGSFGTFYPTYLPENVEKVEEEEVTSAGESIVVLRYAGDYHFSITQKRSQERMVHMPAGDPVDLGFTLGILGERHLTFTYEGVEFWIASDDLPEEEMVAIAQSMVHQVSK